MDQTLYEDGLVEEPFYRDYNLAANGIYMQHPCDPLPEDPSKLVDSMRRDRKSPGPSVDEVENNRELQGLLLGAEAFEVEDYFKHHIVPSIEATDQLQWSGREPMAKHTLPPLQSNYKVSNPAPDLLYGYRKLQAFPEKRQQTQLISMGPELMATDISPSLIYPFFTVEFKGDSGNMWVATNQCLGSGTACVHLAERLNEQLKQSGSENVKLIDSAAFSIAMNTGLACLFVSWKHSELDYYTAHVDAFALQQPEHYIKFRKYVLNILDWGKDKRLREIQGSLDTLTDHMTKTEEEHGPSTQPYVDTMLLNFEKTSQEPGLG
ncbi:hypothetical protein B0J18DRAFT_444996 [Chaetomium sp. MPI-SDFR-AT-0129]|nr:hypothetical protein B0J18DRAFT_444996 [Chaetomium sp. MPI-SDFR-AT-0129]